MKGHADPRDVALGLAVVAGRAGVTAGKVALVPLRVAARSPFVGTVLGRTGERLAETGRTARVEGREQLETAAAGALASPEVERVVDAALAGPLPESVVRVAIDRQVVQRVVEQVLASARLEAALEPATGEQVVARSRSEAGLDQLVGEALESQVVADITTRVIESPELQRLVEEVASSAAVRAALTRQTSSFAGELAAGLRGGMERLDDRAELGRKAEPQAERSAFAGLAARGVAFGIDMAITLVVFLVGAAVAALVSELVGGFKPAWLAGLLAGIGWGTVVATYLVAFWTVTGQTPGMRVMGLRVTVESGRPPGLGRSLVRLVGLFLAIVPVFLGFVPVLFDGRRRALQDYLAGTVVRSGRVAGDLPEVPV